MSISKITYSGALGDHSILLSAHHLNMSGVSLVGYPLFQLLPNQTNPIQSLTYVQYDREHGRCGVS